MESGPVEQEMTQLQAGMAESGIASASHSSVEGSCPDPSPVVEASNPVELLLQSPMSQTGTSMEASTPVELLLQSPMSQTGTSMEASNPVELLLQSPMSQTGTSMEASNPVELLLQSPMSQTGTSMEASNPVELLLQSPMSQTGTSMEASTPVELLLQSPMSQTGTGMESNLPTPYGMGESTALLPDLTSLAAAADEAQLLEGIPPELAETIQALARLDEQSSMGLSPMQ